MNVLADKEGMNFGIILEREMSVLPDCVLPSDELQICSCKRKMAWINKKAILQLNEKVLQNPEKQKCDLEGGLNLLI